MTLGPYERPPCRCLHCQAAEVTHLNVQVVPDEHGTGSHEAHGEELRDWHAKRERFLRFKESFTKKDRGGPLEALRRREPGDDDE